MNFKCAIVMCLAIGATMAVDYCKNMRCAKKPHVACNSPAANGGWGPSCSPDRELINITPELKERILDIHNKIRNQQAAGETPNYGPAARMGTLVWDDGLAEMAEYNARLCIYGHDNCHNTEEWWTSGQNIANGGEMNDKEAIERMVPAWFDLEAKNGYLYGWMDMINKFQGVGESHDPRVQIGHFTQFVTQDASVVGCAGSRYTDDKGKQTILVCNYGFGNMPNIYIYEAGSPASKCKTGNNPDYPALCSVNEDYSEDVKERGGWNFRPIMNPSGDGGFTYWGPNGCDDDVECRKMKANPRKYFTEKGLLAPPKPVSSTPEVVIGPDGGATLKFPKNCDAACQQKGYAEFVKTHPEYGK